MTRTAARAFRLIARMSIVAIALSLAPFTTSAAALTGFPYSMSEDLSGAWATGVMGTLDGGAVTTCHAENATVSAVGFDHAGAQRMRISAREQGWRDLGGCAWNTAVDASNRYYAPYIDQTSDDVVRIGGFTATGGPRWSTPVRTSCFSYRFWTQVHTMVLGADGNLYALIYNHDCRSENARLVSLNAETGALRFDRPLSANAAVSQYGYFGSFPLLSAHTTGLTVLDGNTVRQVDYDGTIHTDAAVDVVRGYDTIITGFTANAEGDAFVSVDAWNNQGSSCARHVQRIDVAGGGHLFPVGDAAGRCVATQGLRATPRGGAVMTAYGNRSDLVAVLSAADTIGFVFPPAVGATVKHITAPQVDLDGNIYFARFLTYDSSGDEHVEVRQTNPYGVTTAVFNTGAQFTAARDTIGTPHHGEGLALTAGAVLLTTCVQPGHCNLGYMNNGSRPPLTLQRLPFKGASVDYPRGAVLGVPAPHHEPLLHVALGDSFSSGEAVKPYTASSDGKGCHRSGQAYPELIGMDRTLDFTTTFRACSGATTLDVLSGSNGERSQLDDVNEETDLVTITIGGNDVKFVDFARACVFGSCGITSAEYLHSLNLVLQALPQRLSHLYHEIALHAPHARVWVLGYPQLVADDADFTACEYLGGAVALDVEDQQGARNLVGALNSTIRDQVVFMGSDFRYLDPSPLFAGHELCSTRQWPYFYGPSVTDPGSSYHPSAEGQSAYAELVKEQAISEHFGW